MSKEFKDMTFEELVKYGVEVELDAIVFDSKTKLWGFGVWKEGEKIDEPYTHWKPSPPSPV